MSAFPDSHTTGTTVTSTTTTSVSPSLRFDPSYIRTIPGMLKVAAVVLDLVAFLCVELGLSFSTHQSSWFGFVSMSAFWTTLILLIFYILHIIEKLQSVPSLLIELIYCATWTVLFFIASIVVAVYAAGINSWAAGSFFGFCAMVVYGVDAFLKFQAWRNGDVAQGVRTVTTTTTTSTATTGPKPATSPTYPSY